MGTSTRLSNDRCARESSRAVNRVARWISVTEHVGVERSSALRFTRLPLPQPLGTGSIHETRGVTVRIRPRVDSREPGFAQLTAPTNFPHLPLDAHAFPRVWGSPYAQGSGVRLADDVGKAIGDGKKAGTDNRRAPRSLEKREKLTG